MTKFHDNQVAQHSLWTQGVDATESPQPSRATVKHLRGRLQVSGASVLSTPDLLAIVLGTGPSSPSVIRQMQALLASTSLQELGTQHLLRLLFLQRVARFSCFFLPLQLFLLFI